MTRRGQKNTSNQSANKSPKCPLWALKMETNIYKQIVKKTSLSRGGGPLAPFGFKWSRRGVPPIPIVHCYGPGEQHRACRHAFHCIPGEDPPAEEKNPVLQRPAPQKDWRAFRFVFSLDFWREPGGRGEQSGQQGRDPLKFHRKATETNMKIGQRKHTQHKKRR